MKLSTRGRYGTRVMVDLALNDDGRPIPLKEIARRQNISQKYLGHIITSLVKAGLVRSIQGSKGGYKLAKPAAKIKISQIIQVLEGSLAPSDCVDTPQICPQISTCVTRDVWIKVKSAIMEVLESITLEDLTSSLKQKQERGKEKSGE